MPRLHAWLDRLGATASALCALHCALIPLLFLWVPALTIGLTSWNDSRHGLATMLWATLRWEPAIVAMVLAFAALVLIAGYLRHGRGVVFLPALAAAALMIAAVTVGRQQTLWLHTVLMVSGGLLLSVAHLLNLRAAHRRIALGNLRGPAS